MRWAAFYNGGIHETDCKQDAVDWVRDSITSQEHEDDILVPEVLQDLEQWARCRGDIGPWTSYLASIELLAEGEEA